MAYDDSSDLEAVSRVLSVSPYNPKVRTVTIVREPLGVNRAFLPAIVKGLGVTSRRFFQNLFTRKETVTVEYPDVMPAYPPRHRGIHRLMHRDDGTVRCVACMLCPTVCPAHCITIIPGERADSNEKFPVLFEIDELRCVVCGLCVEVCPCDALRMDTGEHMPPVESRGDGVLGKMDLLKRGSQSTATQSGKGGKWRDVEDPTAERGPSSNVPAAPR